MNKTLILVVEDDRPIRNLIVTTLKTHDYKYLAAENGASAILEASSHNPDIVLLDLGLPDMDGVDVIRKIRSWSNMPIIVISARTEDSDKIEALDAGAEIIMLDNMSPENMAEAVKMAKGRAETECSGNVTKENIARLTNLGVDYISSGALTHSAPILDVSLKNLHPVN